MVAGAQWVLVTQIWTTHLVAAKNSLLKVRKYLDRRIEYLKVQGQAFVYVGMELPQANDISVQLTQEAFMDVLKLN